jgi:metal-sulfur cluster biosynthetic enzyme
LYLFADRRTLEHMDHVATGTASLASPDQAAPEASSSLGGGPLEWLSQGTDTGTVVGLLYEVIDPEIGVNIVDLGLLYGLRIVEGQVLIRMTLTTPGCPLGGYIEDEIHRALWGLPGISQIGVDLVWEPAWGPELMSDEAKRQLGWQ